MSETGTDHREQEGSGHLQTVQCPQQYMKQVFGINGSRCLSVDEIMVGIYLVYG